MRLVSIVLIFSLLSCKVNQQSDITDRFIEHPEYPLPANKDINFDYTIYSRDLVFYFTSEDIADTSSDILKLVPCRIYGYDENNRLKETEYNWYESIVPTTIISFYDSTGEEIECISKNNEGKYSARASKTLYYNNKKGKTLKSVSFDFEKRIRKGVDKGLGRPGGCIITEDDYEKNKSWALYSVWEYKYDENERLTEKFAPIYGSSQDRYTYKYDDTGRLLEECSYDKKELVWIEKYIYYDGGYEFTRTWYEKGKRRKDWNDKYTPIDTFRYKIDKNGNETDGITIEEGGRQISRHKKFYDDKNRIIKNEIYDEHDKLLGFYIYKYGIKNSVVAKNFFVSSK